MVKPAVVLVTSAVAELFEVEIINETNIALVIAIYDNHVPSI